MKKNRLTRAAIGVAALMVTAAGLPAQAVPITNLKLWLEGGVGVETTGGVPATNNDFITAWRDQSGNGNDAFPTPISGNPALWYEPTYKTNQLNGQSDVLFTLGPGNHEYARLSLTSPLLNTSADYAVFSVIRISSTLAIGEKIIGGNYGGGNTAGLEFYVYQNKLYQFLPPSGLNSPVADVFAGDWHLVENRRVGNTFTLYLDNTIVAQSTYAAGAIGGLRNWTLSAGSDYPAGPLGDMAEEMVYSGTLSNTDNNYVAHYLADKFNLTAVPEPASLAILAIGVGLMMSRRRAHD